MGFRLAPVAILAIAAVTVPLAALSLQGERRWGYRRWQAGSLLLGAVSLMAFRLLALSLASLPIAMVAGAAALAVHLAMTLMYSVRVVENSLRSVFYEPALDEAFAGVPATSPTGAGRCSRASRLGAARA